MSVANEKDVEKQTPRKGPIYDAVITSADETVISVCYSNESNRENEAESSNAQDETSCFRESKSSNFPDSARLVSSAPANSPQSSPFRRCIGRL